MNSSPIATMIEGIPLPAILIGHDDYILGANNAALDLLGPGIKGRHCMTALRQPNVLDSIQACQRDGARHQTRYLTTDGTRDASYDVTCTRVATGRGPGVLVCFKDITHLQQTRQMRRDFVANVSHELRTPLTSLIAFIETLQGPARDDRDATDRFLKIMQEESARMERLVGDLLSLSRVEDREQVRPTDRVIVTEILQSVTHALTPLARDNDVTLSLVLPETPLSALGDGDQLVQVFTNLIENAIIYGGTDQQVTIMAWPEDHAPSVRGRAAVVTVTDQGPGIKQQHIPRLTERFYRVDDHRAKNAGGTGLGLAITKHIVNRHRGRLRISSKLEKGSEFKVILPVSSDR